MLCREVTMSLVVERSIQYLKPRFQIPKTALKRNNARPVPVDFWHSPAVIAENNFIYKSLSNWAFNIAVGCSHACRFCYVPSAATIKQGPRLAEYGVKDPDAEWGNYLLLRPWDEQIFLTALRAAENK